MALNHLFGIYVLILLVSNGFAEPEPLIGGHPVGKIEKDGNKFVVKSDNKYPYVVHLSISETEVTEGMKKMQCGGVLIGASTVLTAAHCIRIMKSEPKIKVTAGKIHLWLQKSQIITVEKYKIHENYKQTCGQRRGEFCQNDIALLWLEKRFVFSSDIETAVLASQKSPDRKHGIVFGWGQTEHHIASLMLRKADHKIIPHSCCKISYPNLIFDETKLCLISDTLSSAVCNGDSGGPFVSNDVDVVLGISSFGKKACDPQKPSIFTNVMKYENWIKSTVKAWSIQEFQQLKFEGEKKNRKTR